MAEDILPSKFDAAIPSPIIPSTQSSVTNSDTPSIPEQVYDIKLDPVCKS